MLLSMLVNLLGIACSANAYSLSSYPKLKAVYDKFNKAGSTCTNVLRDGFYDDDQTKDRHHYRYCGDLGGGCKAIFLHRNGGGLDDMDIDCDGAQSCADDPTFQGETAFKTAYDGYQGVQELSRAAGAYVPDFNASVHPYVVFGNEGSSPSFNPKAYGMVPLSVMVVVCNGHVHYGVWGDTNGGTSTGEASLAMGNLCFPNEGLGGDNGHDPYDVLYIGFRNDTAYPGYGGKNHANWKGTTREFEDSIKRLGDSLVKGL
ncbi:glycoside hydrolase family 75 protein, partial [Dothistroma septosporum NZE10]